MADAGEVIATRQGDGLGAGNRVGQALRRPGELVARQPDLRLPVADKLARLERLLDAIQRDWTVATLGEVASIAQRAS